MADITPKTLIKSGDFPFPITDGPEESRYLTWIRNRSNYMAVRGMLDYVRAISVLLRGILVNFLIFLPYLLFLSVLVAISYFKEFPPPYIVTKSLLILFAIWIVLFPILTPFFRIVKYKKTRATGSDSSVQQRDKYERVFGGFLIVIVLVAGIESLPEMLDIFRSNISLPTLASTAAGVTALFTLVPKLISKLGEGIVKKLAIVVLGALGLVVPLIVVFTVASSLVFGPPADRTILAAVAGVSFPIFTIIAVVIGVLVGAFKKKDTMGVSMLVGVSVALVAVFFATDNFVVGKYIEPEEDLQFAAFSALQRESDATRDELAKIAGAEPGEYLKEFAEYASTELHLLPEEQRSEELQQLAEIAQQAGLYPEFSEVERVIAKHDSLCIILEEPSAECVAFGEEKLMLASSAQVLKGVFETQSTEELASYVLGVSDEELLTLYIAKESYPFLIDASALEWDSTGTNCSGFTARAEVVDDTGEESSKPALCEIQDTFTNTSEWFLVLRQELAAKASVSLMGTRYFDSEEATAVRVNAFWPKVLFVLILAVQLLFFCWLTIDVNLTSIHGLYRDRLASAFLIGKDTRGDIGIEEDIDLMDICQHSAGSVAPYHLINTALNLQSSKDIGIRDRKSDFFIFSKKFIGGKRTGYCRSEHMEEVFPQMDLATAMAISAAAASPNMGRATSPGLVAIMTLLNIRLGFWIPNPGVLEKWNADRKGNGVKGSSIDFENVFEEELIEVQNRWRNVYGASERQLARSEDKTLLSAPSLTHKLAGIGYSGGGIRSATVNLGITQALERAGVFDHMDFMSTVSGGGYLGSSISTLMRQKEGYKQTTDTDEAPDNILEGLTDVVQNSIGEIFQWRIRPYALVREALGSVNETSKWVNVSDGGHIENLAAIELLRRRCKYIIIGDGESDPDHAFNGLATLLRTARIDLGVEIKIDLDKLRLDSDGYCKGHWALGRIVYPQEKEQGYLLYLKSSLTGDEDELIRQYRRVNPAFPHESTADQFFSEGQFEAYRSLGQHIGEQVVKAGGRKGDQQMSFQSFEQWMQALEEV